MRRHLVTAIIASMGPQRNRTRNAQRPVPPAIATPQFARPDCDRPFNHLAILSANLPKRSRRATLALELTIRE